MFNSLLHYVPSVFKTQKKKKKKEKEKEISEAIELRSAKMDRRDFSALAVRQIAHRLMTPASQNLDFKIHIVFQTKSAYIT